MSRHLYELYRLGNTEVVEQALTDGTLYATIIDHRKNYSHPSQVDYQTLERSAMAFLPLAELRNLYRQGYRRMQGQMIYGGAVPFDRLIT